MGARVRVADRTSPPQWRTTPCPTCGHKVAALNGAYLRWRREFAGIDQRTMAARIGVSGPYLSDIERNRRTCPAAVELAYRRLRRP